MIRSVCLAAAAALLLVVPSSASAYWPFYGGYGYPWANGYGYGYAANYYGGYIPAPPYYSVFPPVYYSSQITKRHYGASPYAWTAGMEPITYVNQAPVAAAEPLLIENPFVQGARRTSVTPPTDSATAEIKADVKTEPKPLRIDNPYVAKASR